MTTVYCVLRGNTTQAPTLAQWQTLFEFAREQDLPRYLRWASGGRLHQDIFTSPKFSRGLGSTPDSRARLYLFGFEIESSLLLNQVASPNLQQAYARLVAVAQYLHDQGIAPYSNIQNLPTEETIEDFIEQRMLTVKDAGVAICEAYQQRYLVELGDANWTRNAVAADGALFEASFEFALRKAGVAAGFPANQINNLIVDELWIGDDAIAERDAYLVADRALGAGSLWGAG